MKKMIIGAAVFVAAVAAARRFAPALHESAMKKCQEMFGQQAGSPAGTACMSAATPGPGQAVADEPERAEATQAS